MSPAWLWVLVAVQVAIPASYYLGWRGEDDERFAWRMFSAVRLKRCNIEVYDGDPTHGAGAPAAPRVDVAETVHASWARSLARGRPYVIERFLATRCARTGVAQATLVRRCQGPSGRRLPEDLFRLECPTQRFAHELSAPAERGAEEAP